MKKLNLKYIVGMCVRSLYRIRKVTFLGDAYALKTYIRSSENSNIILKNGNALKCRFNLSGSNKIISKAQLNNVDVLMVGENNQLIIEGRYIRDSKIVIRGNNCKVYIGNESTSSNMCLVCMGNHTCVTIGEECMLADNVEIWASDTHAVLDSKGMLLNPSKSINIGNHVWIGKQVAIMKGVTIGDNAIIGMRSMVTKDVAPGTLNVGSPSKVIRENVNWDRNFITKYELA